MQRSVRLRGRDVIFNSTVLITGLLGALWAFDMVLIGSPVVASADSRGEEWRGGAFLASPSLRVAGPSQNATRVAER